MKIQNMLMVFAIALLFIFPFALSAQDLVGNSSLRLEASQAKLNKQTAQLSDKKTASSIQLIRLKDSTTDRVEQDNENDGDILFKFNLPASKLYSIRTHVNRLDEIEKGKPVVTKFIRLQIGNQRCTRRVVSDRHSYNLHVLGVFAMDEGVQEVKIWLPKELAFESMEIKEYTPTKVPKQVANYIPSVLPPSSHPRLWVNPESLKEVQDRLTKGENFPIWQSVQDIANKPFDFDYNPRKEIFHNKALEEAVQAKAFKYLVANDTTSGRGAIDLMKKYLAMLEFGNIKYGDITREIGRAIYTAALTYDWCYNLMTTEDKDLFRNKMMRLCMEMEMGWPPFKEIEKVVNGHASEAQVNRDFLSMSIAIYDEDPIPYQYTSYLLLEELLPMRAFEYQSGRHNQGIDYGAYRHAWEMHAAWLFYRMTGKRIFNDNITNLKNYWLHMRLPNGEMFRDGDVFTPHGAYWKASETMFLDYTYDNDPIMKGELMRQGGYHNSPILFLLLNNPDLNPDFSRNSFAHSIDNGRILGGVIARTSWDMTENSNAVVAEIKGGGYHFGNHQHSDAGAFQIYYQGPQVWDLGIYMSYGTPYDFNFNKRSIAHSTVLIKDPSEELHLRTRLNDGGTRFNQKTPASPQEVKSHPWFQNGTVLSADAKQQYSYFKVDLTTAYDNHKISNYTRSFCFLNFGRDDIPAAIIVADDIEGSRKGVDKFWKINTLNLPFSTDSTIVLHNSHNGNVGKTHLNILLPLPEGREIEISNIKDTSSVLGAQYLLKSKYTEANGYQVVVYPKNESERTRFLTVFQMARDNIAPLPISYQEKDNQYHIALADMFVCMSATKNKIENTFSFTLNNTGECSILLVDMSAGIWHISNADNNTSFEVEVEEEKNTIQLEGKRGRYVATPLN